MKYEIFDHFLDEKSFDQLKNYFFYQDIKSKPFLWNYNKGIVRDPDLGPTGYEENDWMYTHSFIDQQKNKKSEFLFLIDPILKKINASKIFDVRSNLIIPTKNKIHHESHTDRKIYHKVALFYVTTNNGYTVLDGIAEIDCVENRFLVFDGSLNHHSVSSTDNMRCVINFNFIPYKKIGNMKFSY